MIEDFVDEAVPTDDLFDCEYTAVDAVINEVIVFTGWTERQTENGIRTLISYGEGDNKSAFFTDSKKLKNVVSNPNRHFPFRAMIKVVSYGTMYGFKFFSPESQVTKEDKENFEFYKRSKNRRR